MSDSTDTIVLKGGHTTGDPRLDRIAQYDERNALYPVRKLLGISVPPGRLRSQSWQVPYHFDQGEQGRCVEYGICHDLIASPRRVPLTAVQKVLTDDSLYFGAQVRDDWPGGAYPGADPHYEGTSVLAGMQQAVAMGFYDSYHWCTGEQDVAEAVAWHGPVVIGVNWHEDMMEPTARGFISPTGQVIGGHCVAVTGFNVRTGTYRITNSWGDSYGVRGDCYMLRADMVRLLAEPGAEMAAPSKVTRPGRTVAVGGRP